MKGTKISLNKHTQKKNLLQNNIVQKDASRKGLENHQTDLSMMVPHFWSQEVETEHRGSQPHKSGGQGYGVRVLFKLTCQDLALT